MSEAIDIQYDDEPAVETPAPEPEAPETEAPDTEEQDAEAQQQDPEASEGEDKPEGEDERPAVPEFSPEQQAYINDHIIARQRARAGDAERKAQELEARLHELEQQVQPQGVQGAPAVPELPDVWDPQYEQKMAERDKAVAQRAQWERDQIAQQQAVEQQQQMAVQQYQQQAQADAANYVDRATKMGIEKGDLARAGSLVAEMGLSDQVSKFIVQNEHGPAITMHLSKNLAEAQALSKMDPVAAAVHIATTIAPKAAKVLKKPTPPPDPTGTARGAGMAPKQRGPEGVIYE